ncbi:exoskeleton protein RP43-like [Procambarus clarkii]|uniref:exoskeleton protein RP43-like n=1 Tax=Procambarus clarkii TaxID=6728 RepID=UPI0037447D7A
MVCFNTHYRRARLLLLLLLLSLVATDTASASKLVKLKSRQDLATESSSAPDWISWDSNTEISDTGDFNTDDDYSESLTTEGSDTENWYASNDSVAPDPSSCAYPQEALGSTSGVIRVGSTTETYLDNQDCEWWLQAPRGTVFHITWLSFDLEDDDECSRDYVQIQDVSTTGQILATWRYCGARLPGGFSTIGSQVVVRFHSDGSGVRPGFTLSYTVIRAPIVTWSAGSTPSPAPDGIIDISGPPSFPPSGPPSNPPSGPPIFPNEEASCSTRQEIDGLSGIFSAGSTSSYYQNNQRCEWQLVAPPGTVLRITWLSFDLEAQAECQYDYVEIRESSSDAADVGNCCQNIIRRYCGARLPGGFSTYSRRVVVRFISDSSVVRPGFTLSYTFTPVNGTRSNK